MIGSRNIPCPADVAERSAIIQECTGCSRIGADAAALREFGFSCWGAFADVHRSDIERSLPRDAACPVPILIAATRRFLASPFWLPAVTAGWSMGDVFGTDPAEPFAEGGGLVVEFALRPIAGSKLKSIDDAGAIFERRDGSTFIVPRFAMPAEHLVPWWEVASLTTAQRVAA